MNKVYHLINWENYPSKKTPVNEENLKKIDVALNEVDDRVIELETTKETKMEAGQALVNVEIEEKTGTFTFTRKNGSKFVINTEIKKIPVSFGFDPVSQEFVITHEDGTVTVADLRSVITQNEFEDSDAITFMIRDDGKVVANLKKGSVTEEMLRPDYLAEIKVEREESRKNASTCMTMYEKTSEETKKAIESATVAETKAQEAYSSAEHAVSAEEKVSNDALTAQTAAENACRAEKSASSAAVRAEASESMAVIAETNSRNAAENAIEAERMSRSWAVGGVGVRDGEDRDNSKYYSRIAEESSELSRCYAEQAGKLLDAANKKMNLAKFEIDDDGNLVYQNNTPYEYVVDDDGNLRWGIRQEG